MAHVIDGKKWAEASRKETKEVVEKLKAQGIFPKLVVVLVGENPASVVYVRGKEKASTEVGILSQVDRLPGDISEQALLDHIERLNRNHSVHGILVQLPLPEHISEQTVVSAVSPLKDVDGFHMQNVGALALGLKGFVPCTPLGVMRLFAYENISVNGKHAVILGRSNIVGKPMMQLLLRANATVTICHSHTHNIESLTRQADILIVAIGKAEFVKGDMVKPGAVVIDVGMNRVDGKLYGDVEYASVEPVAVAITPVPKGVGPMTIAMLLDNTLTAANKII